MNALNLKSRVCQLSLIVAGVCGAVQFAQAANTDIANQPLAQAATGVQPNIMYLLDTSGSMAWDYLPDYVNDGQSSSTTAACYDAGDDNDPATGLISGNPDACIAGDPPFMSSDFNKVYYNPSI